MENVIHSLWPEDLATEGPKLPVTILKEQASALSNATKNALRGEVKTSPGDKGGFVHRFYIRVDVLDNYSYLLFIVSHGVSGYPAVVRDPSKDTSDSWAEILGAVDGIPAWSECLNPEELERALQAFFRSDGTKRIIQSLWQQSKAA